jgi:hypothetical protein
MKEPPLWEKIHWKVFNFSARVFGYGLVFVCAVFIFLCVASYTGIRPGDEYPMWLLVLFIPLIVLGVLVTRAKPYYPKEYREWFEKKSKKTKDRITTA